MDSRSLIHFDLIFDHGFGRISKFLKIIGRYNKEVSYKINMQRSMCFFLYEESGIKRERNNKTNTFTIVPQSVKTSIVHVLGGLVLAILFKEF